MLPARLAVRLASLDTLAVVVVGFAVLLDVAVLVVEAGSDTDLL